MSSTDSYQGLDAVIAEHGRALLATATLLTGNRDAGEDLLQAGLERLIRHWRDIRGDPVIYLRRTLYHLAVDSWRARRRRPAVVTRSVTDLDALGALAGDLHAMDDAVHLRQALIQALGQLPPRQRAVLVLRYWEQHTEIEAAEVLGCSVGTVKSSASRGLARLREVFRDWADAESNLAGKGNRT